MAEVIGTVALVASILKIAAAATSLSLSFVDLVSRFRNAGKAARDISNDLSILSIALNELAEVLQKANEMAKERGSNFLNILSATQFAILTAQGEIDEVTKIYQEVGVRPLPNLDQDRDSTSAPNAKKMMQTKSIKAKSCSFIQFFKIKLLFSESKVSRIRAGLESLKSTLLLLSMTVNLSISKYVFSWPLHHSKSYRLISDTDYSYKFSHNATAIDELKVLVTGAKASSLKLKPFGHDVVVKEDIHTLCTEVENMGMARSRGSRWQIQRLAQFSKIATSVAEEEMEKALKAGPPNMTRVDDETIFVEEEMDTVPKAGASGGDKSQRN
jgi:hypothetical protein